MSEPTTPETPAPSPAAGPPLLEVTDLVKHFPIQSAGIIRRNIGAVQAVDGVSFIVNKGESLGLVGESGCGKTTTGRVVTRLYEPTSGSMKFEGDEIGTLNKREMMPY